MADPPAPAASTSTWRDRAGAAAAVCTSFVRQRLEVGADARALAALVRARPLTTVGLGLAAGMVVGLRTGLPRTAPAPGTRAAQLQPVLAAIAVGVARRVVRAAIAEKVWPAPAPPQA